MKSYISYLCTNDGINKPVYLSVTFSFIFN